MKIIVTLMVIASLMIAAEACMCTSMTAEEHFMNADVVLRIRVNSDLQTPNGPVSFDGYYNIQVLSILKGGNFMDDISKNEVDRLNTPTVEALCGVSLDKDVEYTITGWVEYGKLSTDLCELRQVV